MRNPTESF
uniref:Uncharacterized protein n=1 Tax=Arundo donax TaxID=35708 RepID=A0A0A9EMQ8_ARUDO